MTIFEIRVAIENFIKISGCSNFLFLYIFFMQSTIKIRVLADLIY